MRTNSTCLLVVGALSACGGRFSDSVGPDHPSADGGMRDSGPAETMIVRGKWTYTTAWTVTEFGGNGCCDGTIVAGPDGNLWATNRVYARFARISMDGVITNIDLPPIPPENVRVAPVLNPGYRDQGIAVGPDGNLWKPTGRGQIARITPGGPIDQFPLPVFEATGDSIVAGPDDNLWFRVGQNDGSLVQFGRVTPSGQMSLFPDLPHPAGPAVSVWFNERGSGAAGFRTTKGDLVYVPAVVDRDLGRWESPGDLAGKTVIVRQTLDGSRTEFQVPHAPSAIAIDADGNVWFTGWEGGVGDRLAAVAGSISRMTPTGDVTTFRLDHLDPPFEQVKSPVGCVVGPDGNIWFGGWYGGPAVAGIVRVSNFR